MSIPTNISIFIKHIRIRLYKRGINNNAGASWSIQQMINVSISIGNRNRRSINTYLFFFL